MHARFAEVLDASPAAAVTATVNGNPIKAGTYNEILALLNISAKSGTTPTLDVKFQAADGDYSTDPAATQPNWIDIPSSAFAQQNNTGSLGLKLTTFGKWIRPVFTVGGTSPSFTFTLKLIGKN